MATYSTNVYWSKDFEGFQYIPQYGTMGGFSGRMVDVTTSLDPPHECETIQRMSEAFHDLRRQGLI